MAATDDNYRYTVAWIDLLATGDAMGRSVLTRGHHATLDRSARAHAGPAPDGSTPPYACRLRRGRRRGC